MGSIQVWNSQFFKIWTFYQIFFWFFQSLIFSKFFQNFFILHKGTKNHSRTGTINLSKRIFSSKTMSLLSKRRIYSSKTGFTRVICRNIAPFKASDAWWMCIRMCGTVKLSVKPHPHLNEAGWTEQMLHSYTMESRFFIYQSIKWVLKRLANAFSLSRVHIYQTNAFVCLKWGYVNGTAKANEQWRMPSFAFGSVPTDVGKLSEHQRIFVQHQWLCDDLFARIRHVWTLDNF